MSRLRLPTRIGLNVDDRTWEQCIIQPIAAYPVCRNTCLPSRPGRNDRQGCDSEFKTNTFVHLTCHRRIPDREGPFESGFAFGDGLFKVEHTTYAQSLCVSV